MKYRQLYGPEPKLERWIIPSIRSLCYETPDAIYAREFVERRLETAAQLELRNPKYKHEIRYSYRVFGSPPVHGMGPDVVYSDCEGRTNGRISCKDPSLAKDTAQSCISYVVEDEVEAFARVVLVALYRDRAEGDLAEALGRAARE